VYHIFRLTLSGLNSSRDSRACARALQRVNRNARAVAVVTLRQLSLTRYWLGRNKLHAVLEQLAAASSSSEAASEGSGSHEDVESGMHGYTFEQAVLVYSSDVPEEPHSSSSSVSEGPPNSSNVSEASLSSSNVPEAPPSHVPDSGGEVELPAAAPDSLPAIPWRLVGDLAAAGTLTSLEISAPQAAPLLLGDPAGNTAAAAGPSLAATLSGLRSLSVWDIETPVDLADAEELVSSCSNISELHLDVGVRRPTLNGDLMPPDHSQGLAAAAAGAGGGVEWHLPHLRSLSLYGGPPWLVNSWLDRLGPANLTAVTLEHRAASSIDMARLAACTQLQELQLRHIDTERFGKGKQQALALLLQQLTSLTKLAVHGAQMSIVGLGGRVLPEVWGLSELRELDLDNSWWLLEVPSQISSLRHLTFLGIKGTLTDELPHQLGVWLPQLECLVADGNRTLAAIPHSLSRLSRLSVGRCDITSVSAVSDLVHLRELQISGNKLQPPYEALTRLSRLETLYINLLREGSAAVTPSPLPCLRDLSLLGAGQALAASELVGSGRFLTQLHLQSVQQGQVEALGSLGVLPVLQRLVLLSTCLIDSLAPACTWLQQQPRLRSLHVNCLRIPRRGSDAMGPQLGPLPSGLQELTLVGADVWGDASVQQSLVPLSALRVLQLNSGRYKPPPLPTWLSDWVLSLEHLEVLGLMEVAAGFQGVEALKQLPLLRSVSAATSADGIPGITRALAAAPHLCWETPEEAETG
jgi:hypothetical protein